MGVRLPQLPKGLSPALLTELLHLDGALPAGSSVREVQRAQLGDGTGMMAEIARLSLEFDGDPGKAPTTLIAKFSSSNETNRSVANTFNLPERETRYAAELDHQTDIRTPKTYYAGTDEDRFLLLMEDLTAYEVGDQALGADLARTQLAVDELAKLHAPFWAKVDSLDWVPHIADSYHAEFMAGLAESGYDGLMEKFSDFVSPRFVALRDRYLANVADLQALMDADPVTLVHGDYRMANLLFGTAADHDPVVVLDWQGPLRARGINDVALFLGQSTQTAVRRQHERALLERYVNGLTEGGVTGLDMATMWEQYRIAVLYNWVYVFAVAGTLDAHNEAAYAWMAKMVARQSAAGDDLDVYTLLPR